MYKPWNVDGFACHLQRRPGLKRFLGVTKLLPLKSRDRRHKHRHTRGQSAGAIYSHLPETSDPVGVQGLFVSGQRRDLAGGRLFRHLREVSAGLKG